MNDQTTLLLANLRNAVAKNAIDSFEEMRYSGEYEALETALQGFGRCKRAIGTLSRELDPTRVSSKCYAKKVRVDSESY